MRGKEYVEAVRPIVAIGLLDNDEFSLVFLERAISELMPEARVHIRA